MKTCRGVRGAVGVDANSEEAIMGATRDLLQSIVDANGIEVGDLACVIFTATADLDAAYPARAAREMGWVDVPLLCTQEMSVAGSLPSCVRVLMLWNTDRAMSEVRHVYLGKARALRPDLCE